jgi:glucosylceramidase
MGIAEIEIFQTSKAGRRLDLVHRGPPPASQGGIILDVDPTRRFQTVLGIGGAMNDATGYNLERMPEPLQGEVLERLFDRERGAGWNFVRICIGASDFSHVRYSLDDTPGDDALTHFSIAHDLEYNVPFLKRALEINPDILFFAAPWSPPAWMKDVGTMVGPAGKLLPKYRAAFARYLCKFVEAFEAEGIPIHALSVQNEVQADHANPNKPPMPQCLYEPEEEADLIANHLVPELRKRGLGTRIWIMDHNWLMAEYAQRCLAHAGCADVVDGIAWHCYEGHPGTVGHLVRQFPKLGQYFTEGNTDSRWVDHRGEEWNPLEAIFRTGQQSYATWVAVLDQLGGPGEGPFISGKESTRHGMINYHTDTQRLEYHLEYFKIAHLSRFVRRGATRIFSSEDLANVAFENPDGAIVLYLNHNKKYADTATIRIGEDTAIGMTLDPHSYYTVVARRGSW